MTDSEKIVRKRAPDDFFSILRSELSCVNFKMGAFLLVIFIFLTSDVFINRILANINGATSYTSATSYGTIIQGIILVLVYLVLDLLIQKNII